jgi:hypothetical protein
MKTSKPLRVTTPKILQHLLPVLGKDRLGVELDAVDGQFAVGEAHDFAFGGFASAESSYHDLPVPALGWSDAAEAFGLLELANLFFHGACADAQDLGNLRNENTWRFASDGNDLLLGFPRTFFRIRAT